MYSTFIIVCVLVLVGLLLWAIVIERRDRRRAKRTETEDGLSEKRRVFGLAHEEIPLEQRQRTLKVCPDCRELVLLQADVCRYCGCALAVEAKQAPALVLRRAGREIAAGGKKAGGEVETLKP